MKKYKILIGAAALSACAVMAGCSNTQIDLNDYLITEFNGYDTVGTATSTIDFESIVMENAETFGLDDESSELEMLAVYAMLEKAIDGGLDKDKALKNGDVVNFVWDELKTDKLEEKYPVKFKCTDTEYTVEGLEEAEEFNPFDYITVNFSGYAPNGTAEINQDSSIPVRINFTSDKNSGLKNGDIVTVSAGDPDALTTTCLNYGMIPTASEQSYKVEGLASFAMTIDEIPSDMQEKILKQSEDSIRASCSGWSEGNTLKDLKFAGYYFLSAKEGFTPNPTNEIYAVYEVTANITGLKRGGDGETQENGDETYYTFYRYSDIVILPDGTCSVDLSKGEQCGNTIESDYGYWSFFNAVFYKYQGYKDLDSMFSDCITSKIDKYNYVSTVE